MPDNNRVDYIYQVNNRAGSRWTSYKWLTVNNPPQLLTRRRAAGTAGLWQCGLMAAAPGLQWAGWREQWRGNSGNPGTPGSLCRCADTLQRAGEEPDPGPEKTPERTTETFYSKDFESPKFIQLKDWVVQNLVIVYFMGRL